MDIKASVTHKIGPLAAWQWGLIAGGGWLAYSKWRGAQEADSETTDPALDPAVAPGEGTPGYYPVVGAGGTDNGSNIPSDSGDAGNLPPIEVHIDAPEGGWPAGEPGPAGPAGPAGPPGKAPVNATPVKLAPVHKCPSGKRWDAKRKVCTSCPAGTSWNGKTCAKVKGPAKTKAKAGTASKIVKLIPAAPPGSRSRFIPPSIAPVAKSIGGRVSSPNPTVAQDRRFTFGATAGHTPATVIRPPARPAPRPTPAPTRAPVKLAHKPTPKKK